MDIPRAPRTKRKPYLLAGAIVVALVAVTVGFNRLKPAAPTVEAGTLWTGKVERGPMLREVHGNGTLVPEQMRWISAVTAGRVERILVRPGTRVEPSTVLLVLSNPDVQLEALDAERQLTLTQAELASLEASLQNAVLAQEGVVASTHTEFMNAKRAVASAEKLAAEGLASGNELEAARDRMAEMATREESEKKRLEVLRASTLTQLQLQKAQVERLRSIAAFHRGRVQSMQVAAGATGVLQQMGLEEGQWVNPGQLLAKVAQPERLKAVLRIPETQAKDLTIGQTATIDTRNGKVSGTVSRIDPAAQDGSVAVDVTLSGALPQGARPELNVDGTIELEKIGQVLHVNRPVDAQPNATVGLFRMNGSHEAVRVSVRIGRTSVNTVEVLQGLNEGDVVILSDMSRWDGVDRVRVR